MGKFNEAAPYLSMRTRTVILIAAVTLLSRLCNTFAETSTYHLSYDGIVAAKLVSTHLLRGSASEKESDSSNESPLHRGNGKKGAVHPSNGEGNPFLTYSDDVARSGAVYIPMSLAKEITHDIEQGILGLLRSSARTFSEPLKEEKGRWSHYHQKMPIFSTILSSHVKPAVTLWKKKEEIKIRCYSNNDVHSSNTVRKDVQQQRTCTSYHSGQGMTLRISAHFYIDLLSLEEEDKKKEVVAAQIDVTLKTASNYGTANDDDDDDENHSSQEILVRAIPVITSAIQQQSNDGNDAIWSIRSRPTVAEMMEQGVSRSAAATREQHDSDDSEIALDRQVTDGGGSEKLKSWTDLASSLEMTVLSNPLLRNRERLSSTIFTGPGAILEESAGEMESPKEEIYQAEIWQFTQPQTRTSHTQALFIDSTLRSITSSSGVAHAEAFIHPAMIAHPNPLRVVIISSAPLALIREVLKYRGSTLESVIVVGADPDLLSMTKQYMPSLDDCSGFDRGSDSKTESPNSCLHDPSLHIFDGSVDEWIESHNPEDKVDIFFIDVTQDDASELLSIEFHVELWDGSDVDQNRIVVVNYGHAPSIDWDYEHQGSQYPARDYFLRNAPHEESDGGAGYFPVLVYDEPMASPLDTTFIVAFADMESLSFERFTRKSTAAVDLDLVSRIAAPASSSSRPDFPTVVYDGPTHTNYLHTSRAWESWYCSSLPGETLPACNILRNWFDKSYHHSKTEVRMDPIKDHSLYAAEDIPKGHFVLPDDTVWSLRLDALEWRKLNEFVEDFPHAHLYRGLRDAMIVYGFEVGSPFTSGWAMSLASNQTFTNHACRPEDHMVSYPTELDNDGDGVETAFSPILARRPDFAGIVVVALRDIKKGEEIMQDYRTFRYDMEKHPEFEEFLTKMCETGEGLVRVKDE